MIVDLEKIYNRIFDLLSECKHFNFVSKRYQDFASDSNVHPALYLMIDNISIIKLANSGNELVSKFQIHIHTNTRDNVNLSAFEALLPLLKEVEYALAIPINYHEQNLGMPGYVSDCRIENVDFFPSTTDDDIHVAIIDVSVVHTSDYMYREARESEY